MSYAWALALLGLAGGAFLVSRTGHASAPPSSPKGGGDKSTPRHLILKGSKGPDVAEWKTAVLGIGGDDNFDSATDAATLAWQSSHHLDADGKVGHDSWTAAGYVYAATQGNAPVPASSGPKTSPAAVSASAGPSVIGSSGAGLGGHAWAATLPKEDAMAQGEILAAVERGEGIVEWTELTLTDGQRTLVIQVMSRTLRIGTPSDSVAVTVDYLTAQKIADHFDAYLLTPHVSDAIWGAADLKILEVNGKVPPSRPWQGDGTDDTGTYTKRMIDHSDQMDKHGVLDHKLVANEGKDWVISHRIWEEISANSSKKHNGPNYGFYRADGTPVQSVGMMHNMKHVDYSQKLRLMKRFGFLNGGMVDLADVAREPATKGLLSNEGVLPDLRHPDLGGRAA